MSCTYRGRVDASLSLGDYLLLLRDPRDGGDGSCLVYSTTKGLGARNWMPAGSNVTKTAGGFVVEHYARGERLDIYIDEVHQEFIASPLLEGELTKMGAEREFSDLLAQRLHLLGPGLKLIGREARTPAGPVDLLCVDNGCPVAVEVKRRRVVPADAWQLRRYLHSLAQMPEWQNAPAPRGLLVAPVLAKKAKELLDGDEHMDFVRVTYDTLRTEPPTPGNTVDGASSVVDELPEADIIRRALGQDVAKVPGKPAGDAKPHHKHS